MCRGRQYCSAATGTSVDSVPIQSATRRPELSLDLSIGPPQHLRTHKRESHCWLLFQHFTYSTVSAPTTLSPSYLHPLHLRSAHLHPPYICAHCTCALLTCTHRISAPTTPALTAHLHPPYICAHYTCAHRSPITLLSPYLGPKH